MLFCCAAVWLVLDAEHSCVQRLMLCFLVSNTLQYLNHVLCLLLALKSFLICCLDCQTWSACLLLHHCICIASIHLECMIFHCMFSIVSLLSVLDAIYSCVQHWTQVVATSNTYSWLNPIFKCWFGFACRFPRFIASDTCFDSCACCQTPVLVLCLALPVFPWLFRPCLLSPLHVDLHCVVLSAFCFITCICIRAVMLTIWCSHEPGFAPFETQVALLSL